MGILFDFYKFQLLVEELQKATEPEKPYFECVLIDGNGNEFVDEAAYAAYWEGL